MTNRFSQDSSQSRECALPQSRVGDGSTIKFLDDCSVDIIKQVRAVSHTVPERESPLQSRDFGMMGFPGLPKIEGFEQEAPYKSSGVFDSIVHGIKHAFVHDDTLDEKVKQHLESQMSPREQIEYDKETKAMEEYRKQMVADASRLQVHMAGEEHHIPVPPLTPMHEELQRRVEQTERNIARNVISGMTDEQYAQLQSEFGTYHGKGQHISRASLRESESQDMIHIPPKPGPAIEEYYKLLAAETERYLSAN